MTKSPTRESPPQANEEPPSRHRNIYDYDGEYEFPTVQHWTGQTLQHRRRDVGFPSNFVTGFRYAPPCRITVVDAGGSSVRSRKLGLQSCTCPQARLRSQAAKPTA
jgi:hypothetical protein